MPWFKQVSRTWVWCFWWAPAKNFILTEDILIIYIAPGLSSARFGWPRTSIWSGMVLLTTYMLFIFPFYYLLTGKVSVLSLQVDSQSLSSSVSFFIRYWLFTCTIFACYYVTIITPISLLSGLNLNYMLNPPPLPVDWVQGPNYRLISCVLVFTVFALFRGIFMLLEILLRSLFIPIAKRKAT